MYSRCVLSSSDLTSDWMRPLSSRILDLARQERGDELQTLDDVQRLQQLLALLGGHVRAVGDHVRQQARLADVARRHGRLRWDRSARLHILLDLALHGLHQSLDLEILGSLVADQLDARGDVLVGGLEREQPQPLLALHDGAHRAVLGLHDLSDLGQRADLVELIGRLDVLALGLALGDEGDERIGRDCLLERLDRLVAPDLQRHDHLGEDDRLAQRHEWQDARTAGSILGGHGGVLGGAVAAALGLLGLAGHQISLALWSGVGGRRLSGVLPAASWRG